MFKKLSLLLISALLLASFAPAFAQDEPVTFIFGSFTNPVQLYGAIVTDGVSFRVLNQGCESLTVFDGATTEVAPSLAKSWESNEDLSEWTFYLQEGVTFQDGTPFNAEAVKFNFDAWRSTENPLHFESQFYEYYEYMFRGVDENSLITDIEIIDDYTVKFILSDSYVQMPATMAMSMFQIHSPAALEEYGEDYGTPEYGFVCTGPYAFTEWISDDRVVLDVYADYWGEIEGNVERVIFRVVPDAAARFSALQAGEIHAKEGASPEELELVETLEELYVEYRPSLNVMYLAFNYRIQEFQDPLVREAISLALNRQLYIDTFYPPGAAEVASTFLPPLMWGFNPDVAIPTYDPEMAQELLAEAGYPEGLSEVNVLGLKEDGTCCTEEVEETMPLTLYWQPAQRPYNPDGEGIGQAMAADLAAIGVEVQLDNAGDWSTYLDLRRRGELIGLYQLGWTGDNGDPDNFSGYFFAECNVAREGFFNFPEICDTLAEAGKLVSKEEREPLYKEADAMLAEHFGRLTIAHTGVPLVLRSEVKGYIPNPVGNEYFRYITIE